MSSDMFMQIGDIKGEAKDSKHKDEIDVLSWNWGMTQSGSMHVGGGGGSGKVNVQDLQFTKYVDTSTPNLINVCCNGKHIPEALLTVRKAGEKPVEYIKIKLKDVLVAEVSTGGSGGEDRLTENVTLNFAKFEYEFQPQNATGQAEGGAIETTWDIQANTE